MVLVCYDLYEKPRQLKHGLIKYKRGKHLGVIWLCSIKVCIQTCCQLEKQLTWQDLLEHLLETFPVQIVLQAARRSFHVQYCILTMLLNNTCIIGEEQRADCNPQKGRLQFLITVRKASMNTNSRYLFKNDKYRLFVVISLKVQRLALIRNDRAVLIGYRNRKVQNESQNRSN